MQIRYFVCSLDFPLSDPQCEHLLSSKCHRIDCWFAFISSQSIPAMLTKSESVFGAVAASKGGAVVADPHACLLDDVNYFLIMEDGKYSTTRKPKKIPQGFEVELLDSIEGLRILKVYKNGADAYDVVYIGTMMIQNGYAYIADTCIYKEEPEPYSYLKYIFITAFVIKYPLQLPDGKSLNEYHDALKPEIRSKLADSIVAQYGNHAERMYLLFDFDIDRAHDIYQPNLCPKCRCRLYRDGNDVCEICQHDLLNDSDESDSIGYELDLYLDDEKQYCWDDVLEDYWMETHKGMDIDDEEDNNLEQLRNLDLGS